MLRDRRHRAAHLLYTADLAHWSLFYFDQRDTRAAGNHWRHGPHLHFVSSIGVPGDAAAVYQQVTHGKRKFPAIHIRYSQRLSNFLAGIIKRPTRQRRHFRHRDTAARRAFPPQGTRREKRRPSFFRGLTWRPSDDLAATLRTTSRRARGPRAPMAFWACGRRGLF